MKAGVREDRRSGYGAAGDARRGGEYDKRILLMDRVKAPDTARKSGARQSLERFFSIICSDLPECFLLKAILRDGASHPLTQRVRRGIAGRSGPHTERVERGIRKGDMIASGTAAPPAELNVLIISLGRA